MLSLRSAPQHQLTYAYRMQLIPPAAIAACLLALLTSSLPSTSSLHITVQQHSGPLPRSASSATPRHAPSKGLAAAAQLQQPGADLSHAHKEAPHHHVPHAGRLEGRRAAAAGGIVGRRRRLQQGNSSSNSSSLLPPSGSPPPLSPALGPGPSSSSSSSIRRPRIYVYNLPNKPYR